MGGDRAQVHHFNGVHTNTHTLHPLELSGCDSTRGTWGDKGREGGCPLGRFGLSLHFFDVVLDTSIVEFLVFFNHVRGDIAPLNDSSTVFEVVDMVCYQLHVSAMFSTCHVCALLCLRLRVYVHVWGPHAHTSK